jgi:TRAP-type uncharacterized transport system substrate-binding protein
MSTYTINAINRKKNHIEVTYSVDGKRQKMGDAPLSDEKALKVFLEEYGVAYETSLKMQDVELPPGVEIETEKVDALVGQTFNLPAKK